MVPQVSFTSGEHHPDQKDQADQAAKCFASTERCC